MTTEITLLSQSHLPSIYFFSSVSSVSSFSTSTAQLFLLLSSATFYFPAAYYPLPVLLVCISANIPLSFSSLFLPHYLWLSPPPSSQFCTSASLSFTPSFLFLSALLFFMPFYSHFPFSISSPASVDCLSKCQMATTATICIINSFMISTTEGVRWGEFVSVMGAGEGLGWRCSFPVFLAGKGKKMISENWENMF